MFQRILVPLDGSLRAEQAISLAARLARASGGSLFFVRVVPPVFGTESIPYPPLALTRLQELEEQQRANARTYLAKRMAAREFAGLEMHATATSGLPASTILQVVQEQNIDLVVLCSHGMVAMA